MSPIADFQEQLQAILSNQEAMGQITAIAQALTGSSMPNKQTAEPQTNVQDVEFVPVEPSIPEQPSPSPSPDIPALLNALGNNALPNVDPKLISVALRIFSEYSAQDDNKIALLSALKPFLKAERLEKMEKAEKIARLSRVVKTALQLLKEEDGNV